MGLYQAGPGEGEAESDTFVGTENLHSRELCGGWCWVIEAMRETGGTLLGGP